jgi:PKHD-type hydroxylase
MRYGKIYEVYRIPQKLIDATLSHLDIEKLKKAKVKVSATESEYSKGRSNSITFINNAEIKARWLKVAQKTNKEMGWDFDLDSIESLQYGEYDITQEYAWHVDQHRHPYDNGRVRKMSFSVFLNDDYIGGEFDIEIHGPNAQQERRYKTFSGAAGYGQKDNEKKGKISVNDALFFQSDYWHRVRPVRRGIRKSLVGWVLGPKFK